MSSDKWPLYDHIWPFFRNYIIIFDKTEIHTVILRCLTGLDLNWFKSYDKKRKKKEISTYLHWASASRKHNSLHRLCSPPRNSVLEVAVEIVTFSESRYEGSADFFFENFTMFPSW